MANSKYSAIVALVCALASSVGCTSSPTSPTTTITAKPATSEIGYAINVPDSAVVASLIRTYPNGVKMSPYEAQARWNYTAAYGGSPNVYYGESAPHCEYVGVGIVVAPMHVATMNEFTSADWPGVLEIGLTYAWVGRFTYTAVPARGSYVYDPTGTVCSH